MTRLFVYGTLMSAERLAHVLGYGPDAGWMAADRIVAPAILFGWRRERDRGLPNVVPDPDAIVVGTLLEVSDADRARLDDYEGVDSGLYEAVDVTVAGAPAVVYRMVRR